MPASCRGAYRTQVQSTVVLSRLTLLTFCSLLFSLNSLAASAPDCPAVIEADFAFLKQPPLEKQASRIARAGIETRCHAELVSASIRTVITTSVYRSLGPPFDERLVRDGWVSPAALLQLNTDSDISVPQRPLKPNRLVGARLMFDAIRKWDFPSATEVIVTVTYSDRPSEFILEQRVRYRTLDGSRWYLDEVLKD